MQGQQAVVEEDVVEVAAVRKRSERNLPHKEDTFNRYWVPFMMLRNGNLIKIIRPIFFDADGGPS